MRVLVTGSAGFIGSHCVKALSENDSLKLIGVDNFNEYYDSGLKRARVSSLCPMIEHVNLDLVCAEELKKLFSTFRPDIVLHLAAQAGVRHSFRAPMDYAHSNLTGHVSLLEAVQSTDSVQRLIYASSSSVYSGVPSLPFSEDVHLGPAKSLYAATKIANETLSEAYSNIHNIDIIGLRFFTVYGPWGRPDMAYWLFSEAIESNRKIKLFNNGDVRRDFTYIDDIVNAIVLMCLEVQSHAKITPQHRVYNIGNNRPQPVIEMVKLLEEFLGKSAAIELAPLPPGDMVETYADISRLQADYAFAPSTTLRDGLKSFTDWYQQHMKDGRGPQSD